MAKDVPMFDFQGVGNVLLEENKGPGFGNFAKLSNVGDVEINNNEPEISGSAVIVNRAKNITARGNSFTRINSGEELYNFIKKNFPEEPEENFKKFFKIVEDQRENSEQSLHHAAYDAGIRKNILESILISVSANSLYEFASEVAKLF